MAVMAAGGGGGFWGGMGGAATVGGMQAGMGMGSTMANAFAQREIGKQNTKSARQFEQYMSGTAYQRAVADMSLAGLNPALMFGSASAASTPNVAAQPTPNVDFDFKAPDLGRGVHSAIQLKKLRSELGILDEGYRKARADATRAEYEKDQIGLYGGNLMASEAGRNWSTEELNLMSKRLMDAQRANVEQTRQFNAYQEPALRAVYELNRDYPWLRKVESVTDAVGSIVRGFLGTGKLGTKVK